MNREVFSASVLDTKSAFFSGGPPVVNGVRLAPLYDAPAIPESSDSGRPVVTVALDARKANVATLMLRSDVEGDDERAQWTARVDVKAVQTSPYEAFVQTVCGTFKRRLCFPLPVDVRKAKLRVARKSFYVETIVPIAQTVTHSVQSMRGLFHTVALDRLPKFGRQKPGWLDMHIQFAFSDVELANRNKYLNTRDPGRIPWADMKDDLYSLLMRSAGFQNPVRVFALADASKADAVYAVLFVAALRIDGPGSTIVADAYVLPVAEGARPLSLAMGALVHPPAMAALWRRLLVGFTERCRAWAHTGSCAPGRRDLRVRRGRGRRGIQRVGTLWCSAGGGDARSDQLALRAAFRPGCGQAYARFRYHGGGRPALRTCALMPTSTQKRLWQSLQGGPPCGAKRQASRELGTPC
ncbi:hypothetical protein AURDEDRAFT_184065 [Auricularia subglabra TFB-10046 SS5]|nr:hypothetical protein AURDEDRAFT_184065 [Auricularia subglabra TFB-10046 SS5]